jgi:hypothetical protein
VFNLPIGRAVFEPGHFYREFRHIADEMEQAFVGENSDGFKVMVLNLRCRTRRFCTAQSFSNCGGAVYWAANEGKTLRGKLGLKRLTKRFSR